MKKYIIFTTSFFLLFSCSNNQTQVTKNQANTGTNQVVSNNSGTQDVSIISELKSQDLGNENQENTTEKLKPKTKIIYNYTFSGFNFEPIDNELTKRRFIGFGSTVASRLIKEKPEYKGKMESEIEQYVPINLIVQEIDNNINAATGVILLKEIISNNGEKYGFFYDKNNFGGSSTPKTKQEIEEYYCGFDNLNCFIKNLETNEIYLIPRLLGVATYKVEKIKIENGFIYLKLDNFGYDSENIKIDINNRIIYKVK